MTEVGKAVQWRSCPEGHLHLGQECPCEHLERYRASFRQAPSDDFAGFGAKSRSSSRSRTSAHSCHAATVRYYSLRGGSDGETGPGCWSTTPSPQDGSRLANVGLEEPRVQDQHAHELPQLLDAGAIETRHVAGAVHHAVESRSHLIVDAVYLSTRLLEAVAHVSYV